MHTVLIEEVSIDTANGLLVRPKLAPAQTFAHIYRDASGITWVENARSLCAREPQRWAHPELFKQILAAVRNEYGESLVLAKETRWLNVSSELQRELEACA